MLTTNMVKKYQIIFVCILLLGLTKTFKFTILSFCNTYSKVLSDVKITISKNKSSHKNSKHLFWTINVNSNF